MSQQATPKQIDHIIRLVNRITGQRFGYISQCDGHAGLDLTQREKKGGMTKAEASAHIDALTARAAREG